MSDHQNTRAQDKKTNIASMFDSIAWRYDFLNHLLSFGFDYLWRKKAIKMIGESYRYPKILDVATGTGDMAIAAVKICPEKVIGIDISEKMLEKGRKKIERKNLSDLVELIICDSENMSFDEGTFDVAMVAFGVRNFSDPRKGLSEMHRVIKKGGMALVLEFSRPDGIVFKYAYNFYFRYLLPFFGALLSGHRKAYKYLNESVMNFAEKEKFMQIMHKAGFSELKQTRLTKGIATIYSGVKK